MAECFLCKKKLSLLEGYSNKDNRYCDKCWNNEQGKINKIVKKEEQKETEEKKHLEKEQTKEPSGRKGFIIAGLLLTIVPLYIFRTLMNPEAIRAQGIIDILMGVSALVIGILSFFLYPNKQ